MSNLNKFFATFFYLGCFPFAAGSLASLIAGLVWIASAQQISIYVIIFLAVTAVGFLTSGRLERDLKEKDPACVVIDEVAGGMIAFFLLPLNFPVLVTAFFLFRAFDMFKIFPAYKLEKIPGSVGIMADDLVAGLYTNLIMHAVLKLI